MVEDTERELKERFIPMNYDEVAFGKLQSLKMGIFSFDDYSYQFYLLEARARLHETEQQRVSRYKSGLIKKLQEVTALQPVFCLTEIVQLAKQASKLHTQYRPLVPAPTMAAPAIPTVAALSYALLEKTMLVISSFAFLGDKYLKPCIIPNPEVMFVPRVKEDECLILASDGLWDVMTNEEVCDMARRRILLWHRKNGAPSSAQRGDGVDPAAQAAAECLSKMALQRGSKDNITVVVVDLKAQRKFKSKPS
ncbi:hypothetical protein GIB67_005979 [Kingdonia uniflora]|uniref:PPM-type phosphatase domain-containing protein n=1 Tax=Kingdonia uniflora TaxID=39325 RepID=A0A7J7MBQ7_9MAGN|nr:hypothetical protein GIB67_005576 [Kingdonia uniflora]KAF6152325.1 hypothetical protein GIB67_005979 [Kingdonia uniflora]